MPLDRLIVTRERVLCRTHAIPKATLVCGGEICVHTRSSLWGEGGTTGRGADAVHTSEFGQWVLEEPPRLESRVSACGKDLDVDSGESP